jgi:DNA-directed RNA polymerase II subunit RPB2
MDKGSKIVEPRRIHGSSWGMLCPVDNPDGGGIGLTKSLTLLCAISTASPPSEVYDIISKFPKFIPIITIHPSTWNPTWTKIFINSDLVGVFSDNAETYHSELLEQRRSRKISKFVSLCWNRIDNEYIVFTDAGRPSRPVYREGVKPEAVNRIKSWEDMDLKLIDYIDAQETESLRINMEAFSPTRPSEIHPTVILSATGSILPYSDHDPATRNAFSCQQAKQASSWFNTAFNKRFDTIATWLNYAQRPRAETWTTSAVLGKNGCIGYGVNVIVALSVYSGYNQEDSILINEGALKRGMFQTTYYHSYEVEEEMTNPAAKIHTEMANVGGDPRFRETVVRKEGYNYDLLDGDGIIIQGKEIDDKTVLVGIVVPVTNASGQVTGYRDKSYTPKRGQHGVIDSVYRYVTREGLRAVKIRIAESRVPVIGDKFAARHGQKGTCGLRVAEEDMPYTASGIRPDLVVNPHAFPSRMTVGQFIETMALKLGLDLGCLVDATAFSTKNRVLEVRDLLDKVGLHPYGHEIMYNGQTGEMMESEIFMGPTYYLRIKQMVEDKINYRTTGPKKLLTHQPVEGRSNDGGLRIGEMERDCLLSHGVSKFLNESLMDRSDKSEVLFQPETGYLDSTADLQGTVLETPYSLGLIIRELEAMHISMKLAAP